MQGSGKTLAYGLPILNRLLSDIQSDVMDGKRRDLKALVLAPTRELALQVATHLRECFNSDLLNRNEPIDSTRKQKGRPKTNDPQPSQVRSPPLVSIAAIVGGMSSQKQQRILCRGVDVLVATPGRLWDILEEVSITLDHVVRVPPVFV
jgi:ATP-dependent RNA helicase DDX24/MAK5